MLWNIGSFKRYILHTGAAGNLLHINGKLIRKGNCDQSLSSYHFNLKENPVPLFKKTPVI
jgi:hypothetical protein